MQIIGLVGGIGCGKSTVAAMLGDLGAIVLDADRAGHLALDELDVRRELIARWGDDVLDAAGRIDRPAVASRVFGLSEAAKAERRFLEGIVHPRIRRHLEAEVNALPDAGVPAIVIDAALLFEAGWDHICRSVLFIDCPAAVRLARAKQRGWTEAEFTAREAAQMPITEKKRLAGHVIDNGGSLASLRQQVDDFWRKHVATPDGATAPE